MGIFVASISPISGATSISSSSSQFKLQQAKRDVERAEQKARSLEAQASDAKQQASQAARYAGAVASQADLAQANAGQARQTLAVIKTTAQLQAQLVNQLKDVVAQTSKTQDSAEPAAASQVTVAPVINTTGQLTGTVVNTTA